MPELWWLWRQRFDLLPCYRKSPIAERGRTPVQQQHLQTSALQTDAHLREKTDQNECCCEQLRLVEKFMALLSNQLYFHDPEQSLRNRRVQYDVDIEDLSVCTSNSQATVPS